MFPIAPPTPITISSNTITSTWQRASCQAFSKCHLRAKTLSWILWVLSNILESSVSDFLMLSQIPDQCIVKGAKICFSSQFPSFPLIVCLVHCFQDCSKQSIMKPKQASPCAAEKQRRENRKGPGRDTRPRPHRARPRPHRAASSN